MALLFSMEAVMAQGEMQVSLTRATAAPFPSSAMAYYNNPMNYFNLTITPMDGRAHDVFISMTLSSDATTTRIWTDDRFVGTMPKINIPSMGKRIGSTEFVQHFYRRLNTNLSESYRGVSDLTLPEGTYNICIEVHDYFDTARVLGSNCMNFDICYNGLAPELTSPNLTPSTTGGYDKLVPSKKTNFAWTGVSSSCFEPNAFEYVIQFVEVYPGQNVQEAVDNNPVLTALDCGRRTFFTFDYQTNPYLKLDSGGVYAVTVEAVPSDPDRVVNLSNDGKSQYMVFVWCGPNTTGIGGSNRGASGGSGSGSTTGNGDGVTDTKITMRDNKSAVLRSLRKPNIVDPRPFATVDGNGALGVTATSVSGDSVSKADYVVSLYEYVGDTSVSMSRPPLKQKVLSNITAHDGNPMEMVSDWSADLVKGNQYMVTLKSNVTFRYSNIYRIRKVEFIDKFPEINRYDSVVVVDGHTDMTSVSIFKWGAGADDYNVLTPAEIVNVGKVVGNGGLIKVKKSELRMMAWKEAKFDGSHSDLIVYDLYVYDESNGSNPIFEKTGIERTNTDVNDLATKVLAGHTYKVIVRARMYYDQVGSENGVDSRSVRFKVESSNETSYNDMDEMFRIKGGMLFEEEQTEYVMRGRTAMAPVLEETTAPDSAKMSFAIGGKDRNGNARKISVYRGFKSDRLINAAKGSESKGEKYHLSAQLDMFTVEGELSQLPSGGWGGPAKVTIMDGVTATMNVAFGTAKDGKGERYDWWYMYGAEQYGETKKVGALRCGGFGGVFAYNMTIDNAAYLSKSPKDLVTGSYGGVRFTPKKNSWVAKGGMQMALSNKELLDAYGTVVLALENEHFSRIYVDMGKEKLSAGNKLMEKGCQKIFAYEMTRENHVLHMIQLPAAVNHEFAYTGTIMEGESVNVGFKGNSIAEKDATAGMSVAMDIETWRNGGEAQCGVMVKGADGKTVRVGNGEVRDLTLADGKRQMPDANKMDKELQSALPSAAKSDAMQMKPKTSVTYEVKESNKGEGLGMTNVRVESDMKRNSEEALLNGEIGAGLQFDGSNVNVMMAQSVAGAEVQKDANHDLKSVKAQTKARIQTEGGDFEFFNDVEFSGTENSSAKVSPFSQCEFGTELPLTHKEKGKKAVVNDVMIASEKADGTLEARRFCVVAGNGQDDVRYNLEKESEKMSAESAGGGFSSGERNELTLKANLYEKRHGQDGYDDREVDVYTGKGKASMKEDAVSWGMPLVGGQSQEVVAQKSISFVTEEAPCTLADQVLFTWPYNGDPFVPCDELDSACYIFIKQNRDDIFRPERLRKEGKALRVFLVNQEKGHTQAVICRYEYYATSKSNADAVPYIKVYMPKSVYKVKNASGTFSPCLVSMMVVDTVEYAKAYEEYSRKAVYTGEPVSQYAVSRQSGIPVYDLYFRLDHMYPTYKTLMDTISSESARIGQGIGFGADKVTIDPSNAVITSELSVINLNRYFAFRNRSYLFDSYKPDDPNQYATGVVLPPIAVLAVNGKQTIDDFYNTHIPEWVSVHESFYYQYAHLLYFQQKAKWVVLEDKPILYDPTVMVTDLSMLAPASMRVSKQHGGFASMTEKELEDIFTLGNTVDRGNLSPLHSTYWFHEGTQMRDAYDWCLPALMQVSSDQVQRVNATHFISNNHIKSSAFVKEKPVICIKDVVSPAIMKENKVFASFFAQIRSYAEWFANLDDKDKSEVRESLYTYDRTKSTLPIVKTLYLTMEAPFTLPKASLVTAYDSWSNEHSQFKSRDYWFDNWVRTNAIASYPGVKPAWSSPWLASSFSPVNTLQYKQAGRRAEYRNYVVNPYYLTVKGNESSFLNTVFGICHDVQSGEQTSLHHNASADVRISIHVPYNKAVKNYISPDMKFVNQ